MAFWPQRASFSFEWDFFLFSPAKEMDLKFPIKSQSFELITEKIRISHDEFYVIIFVLYLLSHSNMHIAIAQSSLIRIR